MRAFGHRVLRLPVAADAPHGLVGHVGGDAEQIQHGLRLALHERHLLLGVAADADAGQPRSRRVAEEPGQHAAVRARAARPDDHVVDRDALLEPLLLQLLHAGDVAEAADRVRAAARDRCSAGGPARDGVRLDPHLARHVGAGRDDA